MSVEAVTPERPAQRSAATAARPRPRVEPVQPSDRSRRQAADRVREAQSPWYFSAPKVLLACAKLTFAPFALLVKVAELCMALVVIGIVVVGAAWYLGYITDTEVMGALKPLGDRLLGMVQAAGLL